MRELVSLVETNFKSKVSIALGEEKRSRKIINAVFFIILSVVCMEISFTKAFRLLSLTNSQVLIFNSILNAQLIISILWIFKEVITKVYLTSDWKEIMVYPIKPGSLLLSKFILCYITNGLVSIFTLIFLFSYGVLSKLSIAYYLQVVLYQIIITAIPIVYLILITLTIFWIISVIKNPNSNHSNNKWLILVDLIVIMLTYLLINNALNNNIGFSGFLMNIFFSGNLGKAVFVKFAIAFAIILIGVLGMYFLGDVYSTIMKSEIFNSRASRRVEVDTENYEFKYNSVIISNIIRDVKLITRTPALRFNCISINFVYSLIGVVILIIFRKYVINLGSMVSGIKCFIVILWALTFQIVNVTNISSFSREGRALNQFRLFPVDMNKILFAKVIVGMLSNSFAFINTTILIVLFSSTFGDFALLEFITIIYMIGITIIQIELDISSMTLKWVDIKDLMSIERVVKMFKPYLIITLLPIVLILIDSLSFHGKLIEYLTPIFLMLIIGVYSIHSIKKIMFWISGAEYS